MIVLYRFDLQANGIDFVLNEQIAVDMLPHYDILLQPLVTSLADTLKSYRSLSKHATILTSKILDNGELELMLSKDLGQCIDGYTKERLIFQNGRRIADILVEIISAHTLYH